MQQVTHSLKRDQRGRVIFGKPIPCPHCGYEAAMYDDVYRETYAVARNHYAQESTEYWRDYALEVADQALLEAIKKSSVHTGIERKATWYHKPFRCCKVAMAANKQPDDREYDEKVITYHPRGN